LRAYDRGERCRAGQSSARSAAETLNNMTWAAISWFLMGAILACVAVAVATDLKGGSSRTAWPSWCCAAISGCGFCREPDPLWASVPGVLALLCGLGLLARYDLIGWGDAKLITLTFAVPAYRVVPLLLAITVTGGVLSCLYLATRLVLRQASPALSPAGPDGDRKSSLRRLVRQEGTRILAHEPMPYALAVLGSGVYGLAAKWLSCK